MPASGRLEVSMAEGARAGLRPFWRCYSRILLTYTTDRFIGGLIDAELPTWRRRPNPIPPTTTRAFLVAETEKERRALGQDEIQSTAGSPEPPDTRCGDGAGGHDRNNG